MKPFSLKVQGPIQARRIDQEIKIGTGRTAYTFDGTDGIRYHLDWLACGILLESLSQPVPNEKPEMTAMRQTIIQNIRGAMNRERHLAA